MKKLIATSCLAISLISCAQLNDLVQELDSQLKESKGQKYVTTYQLRDNVHEAINGQTYLALLKKYKKQHPVVLERYKKCGTRSEISSLPSLKEVTLKAKDMEALAVSLYQPNTNGKLEKDPYAPKGSNRMRFEIKKGSFCKLVTYFKLTK